MNLVLVTTELAELTFVETMKLPSGEGTTLRTSVLKMMLFPKPKCSVYASKYSRICSTILFHTNGAEHDSLADPPW